MVAPPGQTNVLLGFSDMGKNGDMAIFLNSCWWAGEVSHFI